jgi:3-oxoadipate enol-lactonase
MATARIADELVMHYEDDDFADPWASHETVVLLHGFAESGAAWFAWVPHLARRYRVIRPDLRGFGRSTIPPDAERHPFSVSEFAADVAGLFDELALESVHVIGARVGCPVGIALAAAHPDRVRSLSLISGLARGGDVQGLRQRDEVVPLGEFAERIQTAGLSAWFSGSGRARLGRTPSDGQVDFWNRLMAGSNTEVCIAMMRAAARLDVTDLLGRVRAPTLVMAGESSRVQSIGATRDWQRMIPRSELEVVPGDSPHLAATHPDHCAERVLLFLARCDQAVRT